MKGLKTLRVRFALWTAGLLLLTLTLFGLFVYANMSAGLGAAVDEALRLTAAQMAAEVDTKNGKLVSIDNFIEDAEYAGLREQGLSMRVLSPTGQVFQTYGPYRDLPLPHAAFTAPAQSGEFTTIHDAASGHWVRVYSAPVVEDNKRVGTIQVAQNLNSVRQTLNQLLMTLLIGGPLLVAMAGAGGYFLATRALAPIDKITRTAQQISAEDLSARLSLPDTQDEAGRLATTFDAMLGRLEDAFRRERRFTADASHELRTPLAAMQTIIGSTMARRRSPKEYEQVMADLRAETERLRTLVEGLLDLTRSDATHPMAKDTVSLSNLLADVADSLRPLAEEKGLELIANIPDSLRLTGDGDALMRLFVNLIANAINYTEQGQVTVTAHRSLNGFEVAITDTGMGIPGEHLPHIFDRFYRVDPSRSTAGAGLGLAIALNIAHAHGGDISADSEFGKGTSFKVQLPAE